MTNFLQESSILSQLYVLRAQLADAYDRGEETLMYRLSQQIDELQLHCWVCANAL